MERRIIMCRRHPVLAFDYDPSSGKAVGSGRILDCSRLPLELISHGKPAIYAKSIDAWWRRRAIPPTRDGIRGILDSMGIRSAVELLNRSHGLSLSDQYWVKPESSDLEWDTVNFFTNPFDEELGRTLLTARSSSHRFSLNAPDASTGGDLPKRWTIAGDGTRILIKAGRTGQEPVNELIASDLCSRLGIPAVRYNLGEYDNRPVSTCPEMLTDTEELVSAWQILESVKRDNRLSARDQWIRAAQLFGCEGAAVVHATDDWLLVDYLMRNIDRHYNNFGLIRDVETLRVRPAPLFDTGASLWCGELAIDNRDYKAKPFYATYKTPTARRQLRLISDWTRYDLGKLDGWEEQVGRRLSVTGLVPETRITAIATMLSARIREVRSLAESAGDDSTHKTVVMGAETGIGTGMLPWPSPMEQVETGNLHWQSTTSGPRRAVSAVSPAGTQHAGLIGVADAQVGDGEREDGTALLGPVETWPAGELDDLAAGGLEHAVVDRPGGGDQGDGDVGAVFPGHAAQHAHACAVGQCDASDAGRQDLRYAGAGADAETDAGTAVLPSRGVRCHCASFPVSGMVTDGPS